MKKRLFFEDVVKLERDKKLYDLCLRTDQLVLFCLFFETADQMFYCCFCFLCPIHVQMYSANLLAPCFICSVHRSCFPRFCLSISGSTNEGKSQVNKQFDDFEEHDNCAAKVKAKPSS